MEATDIQGVAILDTKRHGWHDLCKGQPTLL